MQRQRQCSHFIKIFFMGALCSLVPSACKQTGLLSTQRPSNSEARNKVFVESSESPESFSIEAAEQGPLVDGGKLVVQALRASALAIGSHKSLALTVDADVNADALQFYACQKEEPFACNPSREKPGLFAAGVLNFPAPPVGRIEIGVRACVRPYNLLPGREPCGPWQTVLYQQEAHGDAKLAALLLEEYQQENMIRDLAGKIRKELVNYQQESKSLNLAESEKAFDKNKENFANMVQNQLVLGEDLSGEILLSDEFSEVESQYWQQRTQGLSLAGGAEAAEPLFVGGVVLLASGILVLGRGSVVDQKNKSKRAELADNLQAWKTQKLRIAAQLETKNGLLQQKGKTVIALNNQIAEVRAQKNISSQTLARMEQSTQKLQTEFDGINKDFNDTLTSYNELDQKIKAAEPQTAVSGKSKLTIIGGFASVLGAAAFIVGGLLGGSSGLQLSTVASPERKLLKNLEPIYDELTQRRLDLFSLQLDKLNYLEAVTE